MSATKQDKERAAFEAWAITATSVRPIVPAWDAWQASAAIKDAEIQELRDALAGLINHVDRETCIHEETKRGGAIWTICRQCNRMWADDEGGFVPHEDSKEVAAARAALQKASN